jgi:hypothetical protein
MTQTTQTSDVFESLQKLNLPTSIHQLIIECHNNHFSTKFHREPLLRHLHLCGLKCQQICDLFDIPAEIAYWVGFLHDIGKPLARKEIKHKNSCELKRVNYSGHAQLGSNLCHWILTKFSRDLLPQEYHESILFCVDNHMCCCAHQASDMVVNQYDCLLHLCMSGIKEKIMCIRMLCMLFAADELARESDYKKDESEAIQHSLELMKMQLLKYETYSNNSNEPGQCIADISKRLHFTTNFSGTNKKKQIIVMMYGLSGSGKSTISQLIKTKLGNKFKIAHVERDNSTLRVAKTLDQIKTLDQLSYQEAYKLIEMNEAKMKVQADWVNSLNEALEDSSNQIIIIDTMQTLYPAWNFTINALSEEAQSVYKSTFKLGMYLIPLHQLGIFTFESKIGTYLSLPPDERMFMPNVNFELGSNHTDHLTIGTGLVSRCLNILEVWCATENNINIGVNEKQPNLIELLQLHNQNLNDVMNLFPQGLLTKQVEFENDTISIQTITYLDGCQTFVGPSRDYRGETLLFDKKEFRWHLLRGSLPVFPDYCSYEKDPKVAEYITSSNEELKSANFVMTFKYDGSLFNVVFLPIGSREFEWISSILSSVSWVTYAIPSGLLVFGSKGRFALGPANPVKQRSKAAIRGSYGTVEAFVNVIEQFVTTCDLQNDLITFHFEAIDKVGSSELTVCYDKAFCPFFGYTVFTNSTKTFHLPPEHREGFKDITPIIRKNCWSDVMEIFQTNYQKILDGNVQIEPEGCVVHIFDEQNEINKWLPVKLKYDFYYVAHKPNSKVNIDRALALQNDEKYIHLRKRLLKCKEKPSIEELLFTSENENEFDAIDAFLSLMQSKESNHEQKSSFAIWCYSVNVKACVDACANQIKKRTKEHYLGLKFNLMRLVLDTWPEKVTKEILLTSLTKN